MSIASHNVQLSMSQVIDFREICSEGPQTLKKSEAWSQTFQKCVVDGPLWTVSVQRSVS